MMNWTLSRANTYETQSKVRFKDAAYKFERNKSKFLRGREKSLLRKWNAFDESEKLANGSKEAFVEREMANALGDYMSTKDARMTAIQKRIDGGFEMNKRNPGGKIHKKEENVEDKKLEEKVDIEQACTPPNLKLDDGHGPLLAPVKQGKKMKFIEGTPVPLGASLLENSLSIQRGKRIRVTIGSSKQIQISDSPLCKGDMPLSLVINNGGINLEASSSNGNESIKAR
ncbi:hypothetical protein GOP47_0005936 [Adiantum capillus-veneris]|uniref:Uncharacterized protein n=1 Tax=Adiantum capillus-veneris TaxID=13818 RepID=A0A9D4ZMK6_ADICA|nr:hypothetical protein GOP47_0005936 [Adiantum capillus-veneris]